MRNVQIRPIPLLFIGLFGLSVSFILLWVALPASSKTQEIIKNGGFEDTNLGNNHNSFRYQPSEAHWTFLGDSGISGNFSTFTADNGVAPQGDQVAFLQGGESSFYQNFVIEDAGFYHLTFNVAQRGGVNDTLGQTVRILVDGYEISRIRPSSDNYSWITTQPVQLEPGYRVILFESLRSEGDNTVFVDNIQLEPIHSTMNITADDSYTLYLNG
ncbi:MAG: hypothetical protein AAF633_14525, partial [Chloroflexota bacterium]